MAKCTKNQTEVEQVIEPANESTDYLIGGFNRGRTEALMCDIDDQWESKKTIAAALLADLESGKAA
ncbi:hypothetical protein GC173_00845 [bacterium]|nr:hypothetical protein [bacterium]